MTTVFTRFCHLLLFWMCCLHLCGGAWGLLRVTAWTSMAVRYSAAEGVGEGLKKTFNGEHPCKMCLALEKESKRAEGDGLPVKSQDSDKLKVTVDLAYAADAPPDGHFPRVTFLKLERLEDELGSTGHPAKLKQPPRRANS